MEVPISKCYKSEKKEKYMSAIIFYLLFFGSFSIGLFFLKKFNDNKILKYEDLEDDTMIILS